MFKYLKLSSPGKIILCGEHSVVYGKKALACSINLRTNLKAEYSNSSLFSLKLNDINKSIELNQTQFESIQNESIENDFDKIIEYLNFKKSDDKHFDSIKFLILALDQLTWEKLSGLDVQIESEIPLASGLGSSASFSVCLATLFLLLTSSINPKLSQNDLVIINKYAFYLEKLFHGKPSGIDNSVSTYGNFVLFEKGSVVDKFESSLDLNVLITNSGVPKQTLEQVKKVRNLYERNKEILDHLMNSIDTLVGKFVVLLKQESSIEKSILLNDLITLNQGLLYSLQVSNREINSIVNLANEFGFHTKITGAGGGGCCITLLNGEKTSQRVTQLISKLKDNNFMPFQTKLGTGGVCIEKFEF